MTRAKLALSIAFLGLTFVALNAQGLTWASAGLALLGFVVFGIAWVVVLYLIRVLAARRRA